MGCPCLIHPPPWLFLGWGMQGVIAEMGTGGPEMTPGHCRSPSPAQSRGGCAAGMGRERGSLPHSPHSLFPGLEGSPKGSSLPVLQSPNHTHSTRKVKRKSQLQHQQQLALEVMIISQQHYTPREAE